MKTLITRYSLISFVVIAYAGQFIIRFWEASEGGFEPGLSFILDVVAVASPTIAAIVAIAISQGRPGLRNYYRRIFAWRIHPKWYLAAVLLPIGLYLAAFGLYVMLGGTFPSGFSPEVRLAQATPLVAPHLQLLLAWTQNIPLLLVPFIVLPVFALFGGGQEEAGWRGFMLPVLQTRFNAFVSSLIVAVTWTFWHLPLFILPGYPQNNIPILGYLLHIIPLTILFTWLYNSSNGSALVCVLCHGMFNAIGFVTIQIVTLSNLPDPQVFLLGLEWLLAITLVVRFGTTTLSAKANEPVIEETAIRWQLSS